MTRVRTLGNWSLKAATLLLLAFGISITSPRAQEGPPPARVEMAVAGMQTLAPQIQVPGTVISRNDSRIAAESTGRIIWIADVGDIVAEGDILARIDDRTAQVQLIQARAAVARLEADVAFRAEEVVRIRDLASRNQSPARRLEEVISQHQMGEQDLVTARAALQRAQDELDRTQVKAPFPGRVVERIAQIGEFSSAGRELVRLVDTSQVEVRAQAPISVSPFVSDNMEVRVTDDATTVTAPIRTVVRVGDEVSRMMEIRLMLEPDQWVIGSAVKVSLPSAVAKEVIAVPRDALILRSNSTYIYTISDDNVASRVDVRTGAASGNYIEVIGSITPGQRVVVRGGERLRDGQTVVDANS